MSDYTLHHSFSPLIDKSTIYTTGVAIIDNRSIDKKEEKLSQAIEHYYYHHEKE